MVHDAFARPLLVAPLSAEIVCNVPLHAPLVTSIGDVWPLATTTPAVHLDSSLYDGAYTAIASGQTIVLPGAPPQWTHMQLMHRQVPLIC